jgi:hypothetical protein
MFSRNISETDVRFIIEQGVAIEKYDNDTPYPSKLLLGISNSKPLHVVAAFNNTDQEIIIITVYRPDPLLWENDFKSRRIK